MTVRLLPEAERRRRSLAIQALDARWLDEQAAKQDDLSEPPLEGDYAQHAFTMEADTADDEDFWQQFALIVPPSDTSSAGVP